MIQKRISTFFILLFSVIFLVGCNFQNAPVKSDEVIISEVNGVKLTLTEYKKNLILFGNQYESVFGKDIWNQEVRDGVTYKESFRSEMFERMIIQELVFQHSDLNGIEISEEAINNELEKFKEKNKNNDIFSEESDSIEIDDDFLRRQFQYELIVNEWKNNFLLDGTINQQVIESYYNENKSHFTDVEVRASHILFKTVDENLASIPESEIEAKYNLAESVLLKIQQGSSFESMAMEYSEDELTADIGGDLHYFKAGEMAAKFNEAVDLLEIGEVSDIIQTIHGYHIIKLYDRIEEVAPLSEVYDGIIAKLQSDIFDIKIASLYADADIVEYKDLINNIGGLYD